jgi:thiol-disulfide isomerase/thioredoxin
MEGRLMRRLVTGALALLALGPALGALDEPRDKPKQETPSAQKQLQALMQEVNQKRQEAERAYQEALKAYRLAMAQTGAAYADRLLELAAKHPDDPAGFEALVWVATAAGAEARRDQALELLLKHQAENPKIGAICTHLATNLSPTAERLLRAILGRNPSREAEGLACYGLALGLKKRAQGAPGPDADKAVAEATQLLRRVSTQFADVKSGDTPLGTLVGTQGTGQGMPPRPAIPQVPPEVPAHLAVGKVAPEIEGEGIDGKKFKLSDFRGKVVVLAFWGHWCGPCRAMYPHERALVKDLEGKPFALVGINSDRDREALKDTMEREQITWRSFWDGGSTRGPIATAWAVRGWPTVYILDHKGVIRAHSVGGGALKDEVVAKLIQEAEEDPGKKP